MQKVWASAYRKIVHTEPNLTCLKYKMWKFSKIEIWLENWLKWWRIYLEVLEIYFDANFLCTSSPRAKQVDALARALHTEAMRGAQGVFGSATIYTFCKFLYVWELIEERHFSRYFSALKTGTIMLKKNFWFFLLVDFLSN